ncbi:hypothetical protein GCM10023166_30260 [Paeniglutamicibacter cryotolerans]|uniref:Uncharacterized protein n=1 Tax=Paeniglutamicibacter cryotolerans TaxID=670079 RepID=A0A839QGG2_9MICC|nr:hypothetical protein [Paeniglutamicibacter cryotolerans]
MTLLPMPAGMHHWTAAARVVPLVLPLAEALARHLQPGTPGHATVAGQTAQTSGAGPPPAGAPHGTDPFRPWAAEAVERRPFQATPALARFREPRPPHGSHKDVTT